jgi:hypothetical protein
VRALRDDVDPVRGSKTNRPGPDGLQRMHYVAVINRLRILPNVRWQTEDGLVHQASMHNNRTLCEMGHTPWHPDLLHLPIVVHTTDRVNCVEYMGYVTWWDYPVD